MAAFLVRPAGEADRAVLIEHTIALNRFEQAFTQDRAPDAASAAAVIDHFTRRVGESGLFLVAEAAGRVIGHLVLAIETAPPYLAAEYRREAWVADAFVQEIWRGKGAFRTMLAVAQAHAVQAGCRRLHIGVLAGNDRAERIYRQAGFRTYAAELVKELDLSDAPACVAGPSAPRPS
jgi:GNAT superfamily N-acetyltransferase